MDTYIFEVSKYISVQAKNIDEALYKFHEGFSDKESEEEIISIFKNNNFFENDDDYEEND